MQDHQSQKIKKRKNKKIPMARKMLDGPPENKAVFAPQDTKRVNDVLSDRRTPSVLPC